MRMAYEFWNQASLEEMGQVLNTPYGARCFLAQAVRPIRRVYQAVLMHLLALGAFWSSNGEIDVFESKGS